MSVLKLNVYLFFVFFVTNTLLGQNVLLPKNIENIVKQNNVGDINTSEIQDFLESNKSQFEGSLSPFDENNMKIEQTLENDKELILNESVINSDDEEEINSSEVDEKINPPEDGINTIISDALTYYGYKIFEKDPDNFQNPLNFAVDPNHIVGYGDEIIVMLWGETESYDEYLVSKDGYIFVKNIGQIFVNGLTLEKVEQKLYKNLQKVFSTLGPNSGMSTTYLDVTLGKSSLRPLRIFALGEVAQPGAYNVNSSASLFTSLYYFNGPTINGSLRDIRLIRGGKQITSIDFYDFLLSGKQVGDVKLQRGDVIFVPQRGKSIAMKGEIKRPQIFELKEDETLKDLITYAGGFVTSTYTKRAQIKRVVPPTDRSVYGDRIIIDIEIGNLLPELPDVKLIDGDEITFFKISDIVSNSVSVEGAVRRPGKFGYINNMTVSDLILKADSLTSDAYKEVAYIYRNDVDGIAKQIAININEELSVGEDVRTKLIPGDLLKIDFFSRLFYRSNLAITGHAKTPGFFNYRSGITVSDLIYEGGGFKDQRWINDAYLERSELYRLDPKTLKRYMIPFRLDSVLNNRSIANLELMRGDSIHIYNNNTAIGLESRTVSITGYVKKPTKYNYFNGMTIYDLLFAAGGIEDDIFLKDMYKERVDLFRYNQMAQKDEIMSFDMNDIEANKNSNKQFKLLPGDRLRVYSKNIYSRKKDITIFGDVKSPGVYEINTKMFLIDFILMAGGLNGQYDSFRVDVDREENGENKYISRYFKNDSTLMGNSKEFPLKAGDKVYVRLSYKNRLKKINSVTIAGGIKYPGVYPIIDDETKVLDIINLAGGVVKLSNPLASKLIREGKSVNIGFSKLLKNSRSKINFLVAAGDSIIIGEKSDLINVTGNVRNPGVYQYIKGKNLNYYIKNAGGVNRDGSIYEITLIHPDGKTKNVNPFYFSPTVHDGSIINVGSKVEREPFSITEYVVALTDIYADFTQAMILLRLSQN